MDYIRFGLACPTDPLGCLASSGNNGVLPPGENVGDILEWNGDEWIVTTNTSTLPDGNSNQDILIWNGSQWLPGPNTQSGIPDGNNPGDLLVWDGTKWVANTKLFVAGLPDGTANDDFLRWSVADNEWKLYKFYVFYNVILGFSHDEGNDAITLCQIVRQGDYQVIFRFPELYSITSGGDPSPLITGNHTIYALPAALIPATDQLIPIVVEDGDGLKIGTLFIQADGQYYIRAQTGQTFTPTVGGSVILGGAIVSYQINY